MIGRIAFVQQRVCGVLIGFILAIYSANAAAIERNITHTNWTERWITNDIEVRMPTNVFVEQFHTNFVQKYLTNVVEVYATNWVTDKLTNFVPVQATRTLRVTEYRTNWNTRTLTNQIPVSANRTNFVQQWQTNLKTFTLTNWETVLVMKTNWLTQPLTNVVQIDLITNRVAPQSPVVVSKGPVEPSDSRIDAVPAAPATLVSDSLIVEAARTSRSPANRLVEVRLLVRWAGEAAPLQVEQWRVESDTGAILCSAQDQEFRHELPLGRYSVTVKVRRASNGAVLASKSTLLVTASEATILPKATAMK